MILRRIQWPLIGSTTITELQMEEISFLFAEYVAGMVHVTGMLDACPLHTLQITKKYLQSKTQ